jgi:hypothetical protein
MGECSGHDGYARREPDPAGERSANGRKQWGPRLRPDPQRSKANRAAVAVRIIMRYPDMARLLGEALQQQHEHVRHCMTPARGPR